MSEYKIDWRYINDPDAPDIDLSIDNLTSSLAQNMLLIDGQSISVMDNRFGAKGDGVTDDTASINSALSYAKTHNLKEVYFPQGTYLVNGEATPSYVYTNGGIIINFPITLRLHKNAIIQQKTSSQNGYTIINLKNASNVTITGGSIIGDADTHNGTTGESGNGIYLYNSSNITIDGVSISKCWGDGIGFDFNITDGTVKNTNITVKNCVLDSNRRQGITITSANYVYVLNNIIKNAGAVHGTSPMSGIDIEGNPGETSNANIIIQGNQFSNNIGSDLILSDTLDGVKILDNTINTITCAINFATNNVIMKNVLVDGNTIDGSTATTTGIVNGIALNLQNGYGITISKNTIKNFTTNSGNTGINFTGTTDKTIINGNTISNCYYGIRVGTTTNPNLLINSNMIYDTLSTGIFYTAINQNNVVSNNIIKNTTGYGIQYWGTNGSVVGNVISLTQRAAIVLGGTQNTVISGNTCTDFAQGTVSDGGINSWNAQSYNNLIQGNMLKTSNGAVAITIGQTPAGNHNYVRSNICNYMTNAITADANCVVYDNVTSVNMSVSDMQLTTTSATQVTTYLPPLQGNYSVKLYYRVATAPTNVTITVTYKDGSGAIQTLTPVNVTSQAVGSYEVSSLFFNAVQYGITITATAGTMNQVYVSATIKPE